ncbi:protein-tyrosine phosphatase family protein [Priestia flexa]|jgi:protein-tyrosine phosphatase|uniref:Dual specificity protein phosphatase family protein n=2 Tax=Priestia flexa TaxID=86664 RepID=A0A8I1MJ17_9BACI|nr:tyrosine-protein phosphatase [Priestia flexa]MBN8253240.1 dual specificity protein phosphatase family protein [Priestia flexa]MBN8435646.1 dual specificity protein phosphatase family protein [Priestia flexa]MCA0968203.1 tyrosine-protein phosphatase [Priestia flexa]RIV15063.1 protein tyrosine phosphatase [Priestia flexa]
MNSENYQSLIYNRILIGGALDVKEMMLANPVDIIYDLGAEALEHDEPTLRVHMPIVDDKERQDESIERAIRAVVSSYKEGKKTYFHCAGGSNRTGTVAMGVLLALGEAEAGSIEEAEKKAKATRSKINIKPEMKASLQRLFPNA